MNPKELMTERLISEFTGNYMEKLYYFCLRKMGKEIRREQSLLFISREIFFELFF